MRVCEEVAPDRFRNQSRRERYELSESTHSYLLALTIDSSCRGGVHDKG